MPRRVRRDVDGGFPEGPAICAASKKLYRAKYQYLTWLSQKSTGSTKTAPGENGPPCEVHLVKGIPVLFMATFEGARMFYWTRRWMGTQRRLAWSLSRQSKFGLYCCDTERPSHTFEGYLACKNSKRTTQLSLRRRSKWPLRCSMQSRPAKMSRFSKPRPPAARGRSWSHGSRRACFIHSALQGCALLGILIASQQVLVEE